MNFESKLNELNGRMKALQVDLQDRKLLVRKKNALHASLASAHEERKALLASYDKEKLDVEKLNKLSFANFYHSMMNDKQEQLDKEESEALAVKDKLDSLASEINAEQEALDTINETLDHSKDGGSNLEALFEEKKALISEHMPNVWQEVIAKQDQIDTITMTIKEIDEAISAGDQALKQVEHIQGSLHSAQNWGTYDMLGGGLLATLAKRSHLDDAQAEMHGFQNSLKTFSRELGDVSRQTTFDLKINDFLRFSDWFFDGFFVDWAVQARIHEAQSQMNALTARIEDILQGLNEEKEGSMADLRANEETINQLIQGVE